MNLLYITKREAIAHGMTHSGSLYGVPAWTAQDAHNPDVVWGGPKIPLLGAWTFLADLAYEIFASAIPMTCVIATPIRLGKPIA